MRTAGMGLKKISVMRLILSTIFLYVFGLPLSGQAVEIDHPRTLREIKAYSTRSSSDRESLLEMLGKMAQARLIPSGWYPDYIRAVLPYLGDPNIAVRDQTYLLLNQLDIFAEAGMYLTEREFKRLLALKTTCINCEGAVNAILIALPDSINRIDKAQVIEEIAHGTIKEREMAQRTLLAALRNPGGHRSAVEMTQLTNYIGAFLKDPHPPLRKVAVDFLTQKGNKVPALSRALTQSLENRLAHSQNWGEAVTALKILRARLPDSPSVVEIVLKRLDSPETPSTLRLHLASDLRTLGNFLRTPQAYRDLVAAQTLATDSQTTTLIEEALARIESEGNLSQKGIEPGELDTMIINMLRSKIPFVQAKGLKLAEMTGNEHRTVVAEMHKLVGQAAAPELSRSAVQFLAKSPVVNPKPEPVIQRSLSASERAQRVNYLKSHFASLRNPNLDPKVRTKINEYLADEDVRREFLEVGDPAHLAFRRSVMRKAAERDPALHALCQESLIDLK